MMQRSEKRVWLPWLVLLALSLVMTPLEALDGSGLLVWWPRERLSSSDLEW